MFRKLRGLFMSKAKKEQLHLNKIKIDREKRRLQNEKNRIFMKESKSYVRDQLTKNVYETGVSNLILDYAGTIEKQNFCQFCEEPWRCYDLTKDKYSGNWCITCDRYHCSECHGKHGFKSKTWPRVSCGYCYLHIEGNNCDSILKLETPTYKHRSHFCQGCVQHFHNFRSRKHLSTTQITSLFFDKFNRGNRRYCDFLRVAEYNCEPLILRW